MPDLDPWKGKNPFVVEETPSATSLEGVDPWGGKNPFSDEETKSSTILGEIPRGLKAGVQQLRGMGYGVGAIAGEVTGIEPIKEWAKAGLADVEAKTPPPAVGSFADIESVSDVGKYLAYGVSTNLPNMLLSLTGGGIGAVIGKGLVGAAAKGAITKAAEKAIIEQGIKRGALTGAGLSSIGMEAGMIAGDQLTETGKVEPLRAMAGAIPAGILDVIPEWYLAKRLGWLGRDVAKMEGGRAVRALKVAGQQFAMEAPTEAMQSVIERSSVPGKTVTNAEAWNEYINSFILGGATGGVMGGAGGVFTKRANPVIEQLKTDPLNQAIDQQMGELPEERKAVEIPPITIVPSPLIPVTEVPSAGQPGLPPVGPTEPPVIPPATPPVAPPATEPLIPPPGMPPAAPITPEAPVAPIQPPEATLQPDRRADLTQRKKVSEMTTEERDQALLSDHLTGLKNKRAYEETERQPLQTSIDVDGLKYVNDTFGHDAGNELLKKVGDALNRAGGNVYHFHGDEFALEGETPEEISSVVEKAREILKTEPLDFNGQKYTPDFSYGIGSTMVEADTLMQKNKTERRVLKQTAERGQALLPEAGTVAEVSPVEAIVPTTQRQPSEETLQINSMTDGRVMLQDYKGNTLGTFDTPELASKEAVNMGYKVRDNVTPVTPVPKLSKQERVKTGKAKIIPVTKVAETTVTTPKEQKAYVLDKVDGLIAAARERWKAEYKSEYTDKEIDAGSLGKGTFRLETPPVGAETVTIEVPNDGTFKIPNTLRGLLTFQRNMKRMSVSTIASEGIAPPKTKPSKPTGKLTDLITKEAQVETDAIIRARESARNEYINLKDKWIPEAIADEKKWDDFYNAVERKERTLKSLSQEFGGRVPSGNDLYNRRRDAGNRISENERELKVAEETIRRDYPSLAKEMFGEPGKEPSKVMATEMIKPGTSVFSTSIREATISIPSGMLATYETQVAEDPFKNVIVPKGQRIALENLLMAEIQQNTGELGGQVTQVAGINIGEGVFEIDRPYGKLIYNEATGEIGVSPAPTTSNMAAQAAKFGVDKTLLLQTLSKDIVNNDLPGTIANETIQNSLDSFMPRQKAKSIDITIENTYGIVDETVITVTDNGRGMTASEVKRNLLRLGAKGKPGTTTRGGYGLAKAGFLLAPRRAEITTTKQGMQTVLKGTREQFFGVKGAGDPMIETTAVGTDFPNGTTFKLYFYANSTDAEKDNAYALSQWAAQGAFDKYIEKGIFVDGVTINYLNGEYHQTQPTSYDSRHPSELLQIYKKADFDIKGNNLTVYFVEDSQPQNKDWGGKFKPRLITLNKGLALFGIEARQYDIDGMWAQPTWGVIVDFNKTTDVQDINYPFIRNRTQMNNEISDAVSKVINDKIKSLNETDFDLQKADFAEMVAKSPIVNGIRVLIPFKDQAEFDKAAKLVSDNNTLVSDLAGIFNSFKAALAKIGGKEIDLTMTVDPKVHGYRSNPAVVGHEFYAINPFAITGALELMPIFKELTGAGYDTNTAMASNLVHVFVHEYTHNTVGEHQENFTLALAKNYMKLTHGVLARLEQQARRFYEQHGKVLDSIQGDLSGMGKGGSRFSTDNINVYPAREYTGGITDRLGVQTTGAREGTAPYPLPNIVKRTMGTLYSTFTDNPQNLPLAQKKVYDDYIRSQKDLKWYDAAFSVPFRMAQKYKEWKEAWKIHGIDRPEKRSDLTAEHVKYAEAYLKLNESLKKDGLSRKQIKESIGRVERVIIASDIILHDRLATLKQSAQTMSGPARAKIEAQIGELQTLRRFNDEELKAGITDEYGNVIKLNDKEIAAYKSVRTTLDNMMTTMIDWSASQAFRGYRSKKWYNLLLQSAGTDLSKEAVRTLLGKKGLNAAAVNYAKTIKVDIDGIFGRIEQKIVTTPADEISAVGEKYDKLATKVSEELLKLQSYVGKITGVKDSAKLTELTRELFAAYVQTRPQLRQIKDLRNQMNNWIGFFPRYRDQGQHKIRLVEQIFNEETGELTEERPVHSEMFTKKTEYAKAYTKIMDLYADKEGKFPENYVLRLEPVTVSPEQAFQGVSDVNMQKIFDDSISNLKVRGTYFNEKGEKIDIQEQLRDAGLQSIADQFKKRGAMKASIHRSQKYGVIKGYDETDLSRVLLNYISSMSGLMTKQAAAADFMDLMKDVDNPSMFTGLAKYNREMLRNDSRSDEISGKIRSFAFLTYLGGLLKSAVVNLTQNPIVGFAELAKYMREHKVGGFGTADLAYARTMKDVLAGNMTDIENRVIREMVSKGIAQDRYIQSIFEGLRDKHGQTALKVARWLGTPFSMTEIFNRKSAAVVLFRVAYPMYLKQGLSEVEAYDTAFEDARTYIDNVHYAYGKANRPLWMQSGDFTSSVLKTAYTFRGFTHNFLLRQAELMSQGDFRTLLHTLAYVGLFGGLMGLPFFKDLFEWIEKEFGYSPTKSIRKTLRGIGGETLEKFGMSGLPSVIGANISGSLAIGLPYPIGSETPEDTIFGVYGGMFQKAKRAGEAIGRGDITRAATEVLPEFIRNPAVAMRESEFGKEMMEQPGFATTPRGRAILNAEGKPIQIKGHEVALKALGFNPTESAREREMNQTIKRQEAWTAEKKADAGERYRIAKIKKDPNALKDLMANVKEINAGIRSRGIERLVPLTSVSKIIQSSRQVRGKQQMREMAYKRNEL